MPSMYRVPEREREMQPADVGLRVLVFPDPSFGQRGGGATFRRPVADARALDLNDPRASACLLAADLHLFVLLWCYDPPCASCTDLHTECQYCVQRANTTSEMQNICQCSNMIRAAMAPHPQLVLAPSPTHSSTVHSNREQDVAALPPASHTVG